MSAKLTGDRSASAGGGPNLSPTSITKEDAPILSSVASIDWPFYEPFYLVPRRQNHSGTSDGRNVHDGA